MIWSCHKLRAAVALRPNRAQSEGSPSAVAEVVSALDSSHNTITPGWSANLTLPDYGRLARHPTRNRLVREIELRKSQELVLLSNNVLWATPKTYCDHFLDGIS